MLVVVFFELNQTHSTSMSGVEPCDGQQTLWTSRRLSESHADDIILTVIMYEASLGVIAHQLIILRQCLERPRPRMAEINRDPFLCDAEWVSVTHAFVPSGRASQLVGNVPYWVTAPTFKHVLVYTVLRSCLALHKRTRKWTQFKKVRCC